MHRLIASILVLTLLSAGVAIRAAEIDAGSGYQLQNVTVMDPNMRLNDARRMMKEMNEALGVECRDCHNLKDFAVDEDPLKLVAREMMKMERDLNERWFEGKPVVTCFTCHQGQRKPPIQPALSEPETADEGSE